MERMNVKKMWLILLFCGCVVAVAGVPLISMAEEATGQLQKASPPVETGKAQPAAPAEKAEAKKATLEVGSVTGNTALIELTNTVPVRGVQFTVSGVTLTEVRTTKRSAGFLAKFNEANGIVIMVSLSKDEMPAGKGPIAEIVYQKAPPPGSAIGLSAIKIVGSNREEL